MKTPTTYEDLKAECEKSHEREKIGPADGGKSYTEGFRERLELIHRFGFREKTEDILTSKNHE